MTAPFGFSGPWLKVKLFKRRQYASRFRSGAKPIRIISFMPLSQEPIVMFVLPMSISKSILKPVVSFQLSDIYSLLKNCIWVFERHSRPVKERDKFQRESNVFK
jgi:hypothetical protein